MSNTTIQLRKSGQTGNTPADLNYGEVAINYADGKLFYKNGIGIKAIENQKTFSTINVNNSLIIATSPTDILNIVPGNNISISSNTTSKTITINSTASGGGGGGSNAAIDKQRYTANSGDTTFNINYSFPYVLVMINGVVVDSSEYTATSNTDIILNEPTQNGDIVDLIGFTGNNLSIIDQFARNVANAGVDLATSAYDKANTASGNTVYLQSVNDLQNTNITSSNTFTQSAYDTANLKFNTTGGTITGNVTVQNNLVVQGNLAVFGNSTTITTDSLSISDPLIFLANGNIVTDAVDVGLIAHYGGPSGETHTGIFRDPNLKEWIVFERYTTQIQSNNLINIADPSFAYANLYANVVKANLISTYAVVNGLDVFSTMTSAFNSANAGVDLATAAYSAANSATGNTVYLQSVNDLQNTNITSVNAFAGSAFNTGNAALALAQAAYGEANAESTINTTQNTWITNADTLARAAYGQANTASVRSINFIIDGGGNVITVGPKGNVFCDFSGTIQSWTILGDTSGNTTVDISKASYSNFPTFTASGGTSPALSSAQKNQSFSINWTGFTTISANDVLQFAVSGTPTNIKLLTVALKVLS